MPPTRRAVAAVADVRLDAAKAWGEQVGCRASDDRHDAARPSTPKRWCICTPPSTHLELAESSLADGITVLSEKPLAVDRRERAADGRRGRQRRRAARDGGQVPLLSPTWWPARADAGDGSLGAMSGWSRTPSPRGSTCAAGGTADPRCRGGGVIIDNGTHSVDLVRWLAGPVRRGARGRDRPARRVSGRGHGPAASAHRRRGRRHGRPVVEHRQVAGGLRPGLRHRRARSASAGKQSAWRRYGWDWRSFGTGYVKVGRHGRRARCSSAGPCERMEPLLVDAPDGSRPPRSSTRPTSRSASGDWVKVADPELDRSIDVSGPAHPSDRAGRGRGRDRRRHLGVGQRPHPRPGNHASARDCIVGEKTYIAYGVAHRRPGKDQRFRLHLHTPSRSRTA